MGLHDPLWNDRMKSTRRKKRLQKKDFEKKLIALYKEHKQLWLQIQKLGYEPLIPPIQKGWKRIFVLRDDVKQSPRADFFEQLLEKINTVQYSDKKQFKVRRRSRGRKIYIDREQKLKSFYPYEWKSLMLTDAQTFYFSETMMIDSKGACHKIYVFNEPWRFVLKVLPNMVTMLQKKDALLEQRMSEILNYLERNYLTGKLDRLVHGHHKYKWYKETDIKNADPLLNQPMHRVLDEYYYKN